ncbi:MAG: hypothetical protein H6733_04550 [Alphaproteobacteria bacterium]|nr:hypothetical protein [Alphaproteobacteria bacterium]
MRRILCLILLSACAAPEVAPDPVVDDLGTCAGGVSRTGVVTELRFVRPDDGVSDGFDLDGIATGQGESGGCDVPDDVGPDGTKGIDNAFAKLLPALELTEAQAVEDIIQEMIRTGQLLLVPRVDGLDDEVDDTCVGVTLVRGEGEPRLSAAGDFTTYQTFGATSITLLGQSPLDGGTVEVRGFTYTLPFSFLNASFDLTMNDAAMRVTWQPDGSFDGVLGGGIIVEDLLAVAANQGIDDSVLSLLQTLVGSVTDLAPDASGACTQLSATLHFHGVPAFVYAEDLDDGM